MYGTVAGLELDPKEPGYRRIIFRPRPGGSITWAEASLRTSHGETAIRWELKDDAALHVTLAVPQGCHATFVPPPGFDGEASRLTAGIHTLVCFQKPVR